MLRCASASRSLLPTSSSCSRWSSGERSPPPSVMTASASLARHLTSSTSLSPDTRCCCCCWHATHIDCHHYMLPAGGRVWTACRGRGWVQAAPSCCHELPPSSSLVLHPWGSRKETSQFLFILKLYYRRGHLVPRKWTKNLSSAGDPACWQAYRTPQTP